MKLYRDLNKTYEEYEVGTTDFIVEICEEPIDKDFIEVWLYREGYGVKQLMFCIIKSANYIEIIENNIDTYIEKYEKEVQ